MKALSIREPYATIIKLGLKQYETRSWKTKYRGPIYIHASSGRIPKTWKQNKRLMSLVENASLNFGKLVVKANLTDCVYMDEEFIKSVKANETEYLSGFYEVGRYAWKLENIEVVNSSEIVKGHLGIWNL